MLLTPAQMGLMVKGQLWQAPWQLYEARNWVCAVCSGLSRQKAVDHIILQTLIASL